MATKIACDVLAALHCVLEAFKTLTRWLFWRVASELKPPGNAVIDGYLEVAGLGRLPDRETWGKEGRHCLSFEWKRHQANYLSLSQTSALWLLLADRRRLSKTRITLYQTRLRPSRLIMR